VWTVFSTEDEGKPIDITTASNIHYGLTRKEVMKLAYQFEGTDKISQLMGCERPSRWALLLLMDLLLKPFLKNTVRI
jgi:hypothetical protein